MSSKRDGRNLEATDELEALLLESGQQVSLDELKFIDQHPEKSQELMKKWITGQELWLAQLPKLLDEVHELAGTEGLEEAAGVLLKKFELMKKDIQEALTHCDVVDDLKTSEQIVEGVQHLEIQKRDTFEKLQEQHPQIKDSLRQLIQAHLLDESDKSHEQPQNFDH